MEIRKFGRLPDLEIVIRRFPIAVGLMALMTVMLVFRLGFFGDEDMLRAMGGFILGGYLCVGLQLSYESRGRGDDPKRWVWKALAALLAFGLAMFSIPLGFNIILAIIGAIALLGNFAGVGQKRDNGRVWLFTQKLWTGAIFAFVGSIIFTLGIVAIVETVSTLFDIRLDRLSERLLLPLGLAFLAPVYWMGTLPDPQNVGEELSELSFEARALAFLGTWLLAPLTFIYGLVILAYAARILISWDMPNGEIAALVSPFMAVGTLTWLMLEPRVIKSGGFVRLYRRLWFPIMGVAAILLLIAVGVRVREYGITPERFMLMAYGIGSLGLALGFGLRHKGDIRIPTLIAGLFFLLTAFAGKPISDWNQYQRVQDGLKDVAAEGAIQKIREGTLYLVRHDREDWAKKIFPDYEGESDSSPRYAGEWYDYLDAKGFTSKEYTSSLNAAQDWGNVNYIQGSKVDLGATAHFRGNRNLTLSSWPADLSSMTDQDHIYLSDQELVFSLDNEIIRTSAGEAIRDLYRNRPTNEAGRINNVEGAPVYAFEFAEGRKGVLLFLHLGLNGEGNELRGAYGDVLIFTD